MATRKSLAAAIVCAGAVAGLAGCSQDGGVREGSAAGGPKEPVAVTSGATAGPFKGMSADQIADRAIAATKGAASLRMAGAIESDGDPVTVDLAMDSRDNCTGDLGVRGGRAELRRLSDIIYLKGDGTFWRATMDERGSASPDGGGDGVVELMTDRWIKMPGSAIADMRGVCDLDAMLSELDGEEGEPTGMTLGKDAEVDGVPAATLVKKEGRETETAYVAKEGKPYLLKVVRAGGDDAGTVAFSDFGKPVRVQAPPSDEVVDLEKLGGDIQPDPSDGASAESDSGTRPSAEPSSPAPSEPAGEPEDGTESGFGAGAERGASGTS